MGRHNPEASPWTRQIGNSIASQPANANEVIQRLPEIPKAAVWSALNSLMQHEWIVPVDASKQRFRTYKITALGLQWLGRRPANRKGGSGVIAPLTYRQQIMREILEANERAKATSENPCRKGVKKNGREVARNRGAYRTRLRQDAPDTAVRTDEGVSLVSDDCGVV